MTTMHATIDDLELYVSCRLPDERMSWLEGHCEFCDACAQALVHEARLEVAVTALSADRRCGMRADAVVDVVEPLRPAAVPRPYFYALAAAACALLAFAAARFPHDMVAKPSPVMFADASLGIDGGYFALVQDDDDAPAWAGEVLSGGTP